MKRAAVALSIAALSALLMTRLYNLAHTLAAIALGFDPASPAHYHADSLVTSAGLVLTVVFCAWLAKEKASG